MLFVIGDLLLRLCSLHDVTLCLFPVMISSTCSGFSVANPILSTPVVSVNMANVFMTVYIPVSIIVRKCRNFRSCIVRFPCGIA